MEQSAYDKQGADWNQEVFPVIRDLRALLAANGEAIAASTTGTATGLIRLVE